MSLHKLTAGSGYDYLTRHVCAQDATERGHTGLASYYTAKGDIPGVWVGSGITGITGLAVGDPVTEEQMRLLFGSGTHPLAPQLRERLEGPDLTERDYQAVGRLGAPFRIYTPDVSAFRVEVATRLEALNQQAGRPAGAAIPIEDRARVRTEVATELFSAEHGRPPADAREVAATIARHSRPQDHRGRRVRPDLLPGQERQRPVGGRRPRHRRRDRTSPPGRGPGRPGLHRGPRPVHPAGHQRGPPGQRHRPGRGRVHPPRLPRRRPRPAHPRRRRQQGPNPGWAVAEHRRPGAVQGQRRRLRDLQHRPRGPPARRPRPPLRTPPRPDSRGRPVREITGIDPRLLQAWSTRRAGIEVRQAELARQFRADHHRPPTPVESIRLAQQATLETRDAKQEPRPLPAQRATWARQAAEVLGGPDQVRAMLDTTLTPAQHGGDRVDAAWVRHTATRVLDEVQARRAHWQPWHVRAEALRQVRTADLTADQVDAVVDLLVHEVLTALSIPLGSAADDLVEPAALRRADGASVYSIAGEDRYTSARILAAEHRILARAGQPGGRTIAPKVVDLALLEAAANGTTLNAGQAALVRAMATTPARVQLAIAPAGSGKTTAMRALAAAWTDAGGTILGLAPSATAATTLGEQLPHATTETLAKLTWSLDHHPLPDWAARVGPQTLVVVDEAGMADTLTLDRVIEYAVARGASVRLVGDDQQLAAIGAGGVLRDIAASHGAVHLTELMRFADPAEAAATLALRDGLPEALGYYLDAGRVHVGDPTTATDDLFTAWQTDRAIGLDSVMLAPTHDLVGELNQRARGFRLAGAHAHPHHPLGRRQRGLRRGRRHHPHQRPPAPARRHRLGEERRPVDHPRPHR